MEVRRVEGRQRAAKLGEAYRHKAHLGHRSLPLLMSLRWKLLQASGCAEVGSLVSPTLVRCNIQRPSQARCSSASEPILSYPPEQKIRCLESRCYNFTAVWFWQWSSHKEITRKHRNHFTLIREPWRDLCQVLWSLKLQWWFVLGGWFHVTGISVPNRFWNWIKYFYWYSCIADMWLDTFRFISVMLFHIMTYFQYMETQRKTLLLTTVFFFVLSEINHLLIWGLLNSDLFLLKPPLEKRINQFKTNNYFSVLTGFSHFSP